MKSRRQVVALTFTMAVATMSVAVIVPTIQAAASGSGPCGTVADWRPNVWYYYDDRVRSATNLYRAKVGHLSVDGMSPSYAPEKWAFAGSCSSGQPTPTGNPTWLPTDHPFPTMSPPRSASPSASASPTPTPSGKTPTPKPSGS